METPSPAILCMIETLGRGGGAEQLLGNLVPAMRAQGADIEIVAIHDWHDNLIDDLAAAGVTVHQFKLPPKSPVTGSIRLRKLLSKKSYDVFWGHLLGGNTYARLAQRFSPGSHSVVTLHSEGYSANPPRSLKNRVAVAFEGWVLKGADQRVAVSRAVADDWERYFGWHGTAIAYNGVDIETTRRIATTEAPADIRARFAIGPDDFLIVTPARYVEKKGQAYLLEAIRELRRRHHISWRLLMFGHGPMLDQLQNMAMELGVADIVTISPNIPHDVLFPLIHAADLFVLSSLREPFGIAAAEAMAIGTPAVLTDVDGFRELVGHSKSVRLVTPASASALVDALSAIHADQAAARRMAAVAADHVAGKFSIETCATRWIDILNAVHRGEKAPCAELSG